MRGVLLTALGALLLCVCLPQARAAYAVLPLVAEQFVRVHVGLPGGDMWLQLRWDRSEVALFPQAQLRQRSRSWSADSTDVVCFGSVCRRVALAIDWTPSVADDPSVLAPRGARGHDGVLGLGAGSALWSVFAAWRVSSRSLVLMSHADELPAHQRLWHYATPTVPVRSGAEQAWARVDWSSDYTLVPWALAHREHSWSLELYSEDGRRRVARVHVVPERFAATAQDGGQIHLVRAIEGGSNLSASVSTQPAVAAGWPLQSRAWTLGAAMLREGFVVQHNEVSGELWLGCKWLYSVALTPLDQLAWLLVLLPLDVLWVYGIYDSVDYVERLESALGPQRVAALGSAPVSPLSYRHRGFSTALTVATQLAVVLLLYALTLGYGVGAEPFWHESFGAYDRAAVYSTVGVAGALLPVLWLLPVYPNVVAVCGSSTLIAGVWLLAALDPFRVANSVAMLLASALLAVRFAMQLLEVLLGRLWPWRVYSRRSWVWIGVLALLSAWSMWLFAFYTVWLATLTWRADHPGVWAICALAALLALFTAHRLVNQHHTVLAEQRMQAAERRLAALAAAQPAPT